MTLRSEGSFFDAELLARSVAPEPRSTAGRRLFSADARPFDPLLAADGPHDPARDGALCAGDPRRAAPARYALTRVVLNADDFGLAPRTRAVSPRLRAKGLLSDVSLLANGMSFDEAARSLRAAGIGETGVHLCITGGERPVSAPRDVPSLLSRRLLPRSLARRSHGADGRPHPACRGGSANGRRRSRGQRAPASGSRTSTRTRTSTLHPLLFPVAVTLARQFHVPFVRAPRAGDPPGQPDAPLLSGLRARLLARSAAEPGSSSTRPDFPSLRASSGWRKRDT